MNRLSRVIVIPSILILTSLQALAQDSLLRDDWAVAEYKGKPVGYNHSQCFGTDDGFKYVDYDLINQSLAGGTPYQITRQLEVITDREFRITSGLSLTKVNNTEIKSELKVQNTDSKYIVSLANTEAGGKTTSSMWQIDTPLYSTSSYIDKLVSKGGIVQDADSGASAWNFDTNNITSVKVKSQKDTYTYRGNSISGFRFTVDTEGLSSTEGFVDTKGISYWLKDEKNESAYTKVEKDEMPQLGAMEADALIVPGNINIARPFISTNSTIDITWSDVVYELFNLDDNRQKAISHTTAGAKGENHTARVEITRDNRDFTGRVSLPFRDKAFETYLKDDEFIMPNLPQIQKLSKEVLAGETDGWKVSQKLVSWVCNYIQSAMIPETLTTSQILEKKEGKCSEYAILFAAMARAAGLPTRIALGERYQDGAWVGHMWDEVWLGEWIAVDASHNQANPDALLLKLVHSDNVMGTQTVRRGLVGKLGITIDKVDIPDSQSSTTLKTGIYGQTYINTVFDCRFEAPDNWLVQETTDAGTPVVAMLSKASPGSAAYVIFFSVPQGFPASQLLDSRIQATAGGVQNFKLDEKSLKTVDGRPAAYGKWRFTANAEYTQENYVEIVGDRGYLFVFSSQADQWNSVAADFKHIVDSFRHPLIEPTK